MKQTRIHIILGIIPIVGLLSCSTPKQDSSQTKAMQEYGTAIADYSLALRKQVLLLVREGYRDPEKIKQLAKERTSAYREKVIVVSSKNTEFDNLEKILTEQTSEIILNSYIKKDLQESQPTNAPYSSPRETQGSKR